MFRVQNTILSEDIATAKFACDISKCKGACCYVGDAGAPVSREEIPVLKKAYNRLKSELTEKAQQIVEQDGLVKGDDSNGYEINCVDSKECIFVTYNQAGVAECAIQKAYYEGRFSWEKPISCHLYPVRLKRIASLDYANFEYYPELCAAGCERGKKEGIYLADFLKKALIRRYGAGWYEEFSRACEKVRMEKEQVV